MMTSQKRALSSLAVALTFVAVATFAQAQDQPNQSNSAEASAPSSISKASDAPSQGAQKAVQQALDNKSAAPAAGAIPASATAAALANHETSGLSALHDPILRKKVNDVLTKLTPERQRLDKDYQEASAIFPSFCKDWEQKLHDRQANNIGHLIWKLENGLETALYTGYSKVESCETHQSPQGFSIGKLTYEEYHYRLKGKTVEDAEHTQATPEDDTHTTEIFRWEKGKWFY